MPDICVYIIGGINFFRKIYLSGSFKNGEFYEIIFKKKSPY